MANCQGSLLLRYRGSSNYNKLVKEHDGYMLKYLLKTGDVNE